ncbi:MAG: hypothetical protein ACI9P5_004910 [Saprospiraceae bacterium]|jgi:hypothetical protein
MDYTRIIPILTKAVQEQQEIIKTQQDQITAQKDRLEVLEAAVAKLLSEK